MPVEAPTETPAATAAEPAAAPSTSKPTAPVTIPLTLDEYNRLRGVETQFSEFQRAKQAELEAKESERIRALADKGKVDEALEALNKTYLEKINESTQRYAELERQVFSERKAAVIAQALANRIFTSDAAARQAQSILESTIEVHRAADGSLKDVDKTTRRPASETLKEALDSPDFAHFLAPSVTKGGVSQQGNRAAPSTTAETNPLLAHAESYKKSHSREPWMI